MAGPLLDVRDLVRHFPLSRRRPFSPREVVRAVDGVSFTIADGEALGVVGESGCGKSTVGNLVLGLLAPTAGTIRWEDTDLSDVSLGRLRALRRDIQVIFQDPAATLNPRMRVGDQVREPLDIHGIGDTAERPVRVAAMLREVGLSDDHIRRYPHELSGGQRQRVVVARALISRPRLIVCDEPTSALDVSIQAQVVNLLADLKQRSGVAYLFISHNLAVVRNLCDRVAVMYLGRVVEMAPRDALFGHPRHPYSAALIAANPIPNPEEPRRRALLQGDPPSPISPPPGCCFHTRCHLAVDACRRERPVAREVAPGHVVACHVI